MALDIRPSPGECMGGVELHTTARVELGLLAVAGIDARSLEAGAGREGAWATARRNRGVIRLAMARVLVPMAVQRVAGADYDIQISSQVFAIPIEMSLRVEHNYNDSYWLMEERKILGPKDQYCLSASIQRKNVTSTSPKYTISGCIDTIRQSCIAPLRTAISRLYGPKSR